MDIRAARDSDIAAITAITNDVIATSTAIYRDAATDEGERRAWMKARRDAGYPVLVAVEGEDVLGFSSFGDFRVWPGYRHTVEHSVHVRADARGRGLGGQLVGALIEPARAMNKHVMIAGIDAQNDASLKLHTRLGFKKVAHFEQVGRKFDRWLDLVFMQRML